MDRDPLTPAEADEEFLDRVFDRAVGLLEEGSEPSAEDLLAGREDLRAEVEAAVATARQVTPARSPSGPGIPGYQLLTELGRGGMGTVYLARQEVLGGRLVALKVLPAAAALSSRARERFLAEARALAAVRHPHVVTVHDVVAAEGACAYAMEWVEGATLGQVLDALRARSAGPGNGAAASPAMRDVQDLLGGAEHLPESYPLFVCRTGIAIARALSALHRAGLVHRDVKPSNILLRKDGVPLLSDFGLARESEAGLTRGGGFAGTVAYAPPEQLEGAPRRLDARSDVYALGVTLYHALTLHLPFDAPGAKTAPESSPEAMLRLIGSGRARPLRAWNRRLPRDLQTVIHTAMDPDPARRYATADGVAEDLERLISLQPVRARPAGPLSRAVKLLRRHRAAAIGLLLGAVLAIALAAGAIVWNFLAPRWVEEHVRDARLLLLDPSQANALFISAYLVGHPAGVGGLPVQRDALAEAVRNYDAALRWRLADPAIRDERDVVRDALAGKDSGAAGGLSGGARSLGLRAFLAGEIDGALKHWEAWARARDPTGPPDPLVEAALGMVHLVRDEPARAYPRLRAACQAFPGVGFLTTYLADASVRCGDLDVAEGLLRAAAGMGRPDPQNALERVHADLLAAQGKDADAEDLYLRLPHNPLAQLALARFLEARGRQEEAMDGYVEARSMASGPEMCRAYDDAVGRWWGGLSARDRLRRIRDALDELPTASRSLVARLRLYAPAARSKAAALPPETVPAAGADVRLPGVFATLRDWLSSPPLVEAGPKHVAQTLEVENMIRWLEINTYPPVLKLLQLIAWRSPWPDRLSGGIRNLASTFHRSRLRAGATLAPAALLLVTATAAAQTDCPGPRYSHMMAYDSLRARTVLYSGYSGGYLGDTWEWDGLAWSQRFPAFTPVPRLSPNGMVYDSVRGEVLLFGGSNDTVSPPMSGETLSWNGTTWSLESTTGPFRRVGHSMAFDSARGVAVLFGGNGPNPGNWEVSDTWEWDGTTWSQRFPATNPPYRQSGTMVYDSVRQVCVLFGGYYERAPSVTWADTWEWDGVNWTQRTPAHAPPARSGHAMAFDTDRGVALVFGGIVYGTTTPFNDLWEWDGTDWQEVNAPGAPARTYLTGAYDSLRHRFVIYGGWTGGSFGHGDTWEWSPETGWHLVGVGPADLPVARAGEDRSAPEGASVVLDGSLSLSCDVRSYAWTQIAGTPVVLDLTDPARPVFTAPAVPAGGETLTFQLVVTAGALSSAPDVVNVTVTNVNNAPVALAGDDQTVNEGSPVALNGSASYDLDAEPVTFTWVQTAGPAVTVDFTDPVRPTFTAPLVGPTGDTLVFELTVSDLIGVGQDSIQVTVENVNHAPAADAGADQTVAGGAAVALDGSGSQDPDGDTLGHLWTQVSGPSVVLAGDATAAATFTAPPVGPGGATLVFRLSVTDGLGGFDDDEVTVTVQGNNAPPVCALARPSVAELWPPNHKLVPVTILGVTHPENQTVTITITGVTQDEPQNGLGDGDTAPDAVIQGGTVLLRAERAGGGNGRVYRVSFMASDGLGGTCAGQVSVCVPKSKGKNVPPCVDDGQLFNSLGP